MGEFPATANVVACTLAVASVCLVVELGYLSHELALLCLWFHACACVCIDFDEHDTENSSPPGVIVNPKGSPKMESGELRNTGAPKQEKKSQGPIADKGIDFKGTWLDAEGESRDHFISFAAPRERWPLYDNQMQRNAVFELHLLLVKDFAKEAKDGAFLMRFLMARDWVVDAAHKMVLQCLYWRRATLPILMDHDVKAIAKAGIWHVVKGTTKKNDMPILYVRVGRLFQKIDLSASGGEKRDDDYCIAAKIKCLEYYLEELIQNSSHALLRFTVILDIQEFYVSTFRRQDVAMVLKILQDNYPELCGKIFVYPVSPIVTGIYSLVKGWLKPVTVARVNLLSGCPESLQVMKDYVGPRCLPCPLGGEYVV